MESLRTYGEPEFGDLVVVLLIDETVSGTGELIAGAFRAAGFGVVCGTRTRGTAAIMETYPLDHRWQLILVTGFYDTPDGKRITGQGVMPDRDAPLSYAQRVAVTRARQEQAPAAITNDPPLEFACEVLEGIEAFEGP